MDSRYTSILGITFPLDYKDPNLSANTTAGPDATATGDGLSIQGTQAKIKAGTRDPNGRIKGNMGSVFLREGTDADYNAYLKEDDDGGNTGWFPLMTLGGKASGGNTLTFGLTDDEAVLNAAQRYGNILQDSYPISGAVSVVVPPHYASGSGGMCLDIKFSSDKGLTWHSIFPPGGDDIFISDSKIFFPSVPDLTVFNALLLNFDTFNDQVIPANSLVRVDCLQGDGATGINVTITFGPKPHSSVSPNGSTSPGIVMVPIA